jgi:hypothetical protein
MNFEEKDRYGHEKENRNAKEKRKHIMLPNPSA